MDSSRPESASRLQMALWRRLVGAGLRAGLVYEDAQDLASQAIVKSLAAHDPARGPFAALCATTHRNLLKNHWRDRKPIDPIEEEDALPPVWIDPLEGLATAEEKTMMRTLAERILALLDPEEAALFLALAEGLQHLERVAVSDASRRIGLEPLEGWNLFRRIQRKARPYLDEFELAADRSAGMPGFEAEAPGTMQVLPEEKPAGPAQSPDDLESAPPFAAPPGAPPLAGTPRAAGAPGARPEAFPMLLLASACAEAGFGRFAATLTPEQSARFAAFSG